MNHVLMSTFTIFGSTFFEFCSIFTNHLLFYYSFSQKSEDAHEFIIRLQHFLLEELEDSKNNPGLTLHGKTYDNDLYLSMKSFWNLFEGEITEVYMLIPVCAQFHYA